MRDAGSAATATLSRFPSIRSDYFDAIRAWGEMTNDEADHRFAAVGVNSDERKCITRRRGGAARKESGRTDDARRGG